MDHKAEVITDLPHCAIEITFEISELLRTLIWDLSGKNNTHRKTRWLNQSKFHLLSFPHTYYKAVRAQKAPFPRLYQKGALMQGLNFAVSHTLQQLMLHRRPALSPVSAKTQNSLLPTLAQRWQILPVKFNKPQ